MTPKYYPSMLYSITGMAGGDVDKGVKVWVVVKAAARLQWHLVCITGLVQRLAPDMLVDMEVHVGGHSNLSFSEQRLLRSAVMVAVLMRN